MTDAIKIENLYFSPVIMYHLCAALFPFYVSHCMKGLQSLLSTNNHFFSVSPPQHSPVSLISSSTWLNHLVQDHSIGLLYVCMYVCIRGGP
jgi:hypothetical protein